VSSVLERSGTSDGSCFAQWRQGRFGRVRVVMWRSRDHWMDATVGRGSFRSGDVIKRMDANGHDGEHSGRWYTYVLLWGPGGRMDAGSVRAALDLVGAWRLGQFCVCSPLWSWLGGGSGGAVCGDVGVRAWARGRAAVLARGGLVSWACSDDVKAGLAVGARAFACWWRAGDAGALGVSQLSKAVAMRASPAEGVGAW